ncbi:hypothetical protein VitviT2T_018511 [Vitis vinifera]|uniref:Retrotransposon gag domain-containing protein n=1 Tax=Vitis vinifera TaxID=29760 RepID=A0ABY9CZQ2_VITVI|nr:hypothetical protein VitviT2T_018511 [Vitis vinifera]
MGYLIPRNDRDGSFTRDSVAHSLSLVVLEEEGKIYKDEAKEMKRVFGDRDRQKERNPRGSNAKRGMSIKGERIGEQRRGGDILERGNFAGEKNKRSVASSELRAWGESFSTVVFFEEESDSISVLEVIIGIHGSYLVKILRLVRGSDSPSQLEQIPDHRDMDPQYATVDQLAEITDTMVSLRDAILGLVPPPPPPPPPPVQSAPQAGAFVLHGQTKTTLHSVVAPTQIVDDTQAHIDKIEHKMRSLYVSDGIMGWDGYDDMPVAALPVEFCMLDIERYTGIGCPRIHLQLYNTIMRRHRLDEAQMIMLFPLSLSSAAQRWFVSLDPSRRRTWADLGQEFIRQYSFNTIVDVSRRELEALRQGPDESVISFISRWREKIAQIINRPSERDQISMIMRSLQPRFARHLMGFSQTDFDSLVQALYGIEEGISRGLWADSSPSDSKGKKSGSGPRPSDVGTIGMIGHQSSRRPPFQSQFLST